MFAACPLEARGRAVRTCSDLLTRRRYARCLARNLYDPMEVRQPPGTLLTYQTCAADSQSLCPTPRVYTHAQE